MNLLMCACGGNVFSRHDCLRSRLHRSLDCTSLLFVVGNLDAQYSTSARCVMSGPAGAPGGPRRGGANALAPSAVLLELSSLMSRRLQHMLDATVPRVGARWGATAALLLLYWLRVWALGGFYIVTYGLGIYMLNLFIGFITPQVRRRCLAALQLRTRTPTCLATPPPPCQ